jgi:LysR substrate binding domain
MPQVSVRTRSIDQGCSPPLAAGLGVSIVPESLRHLRTNDIAYLRLTGDVPQAALGLASRVDGRSAAVGNFIAVALRIAHDHNK